MPRDSDLSQLNSFDALVAQVSCWSLTCGPKPYKIVGYDTVITGLNPEHGRFSDPKAEILEAMAATQGSATTSKFTVVSLQFHVETP